MIVLAILLITVSLTFWRSLTTKVEQTVAMQVDYEDAALCAKFGFAHGTKEHDGCKLDLLDLRHRHEELIDGALQL
jgi:hypothetical protein